MKDEIDKAMFELRHPVLSFLCEAFGGVCLVLLVFAFCWLCCAASGYHWE